MNLIQTIFSEEKIPIGLWMRNAFAWLDTHFFSYFSFLGDWFGYIIIQSVAAVAGIPPLILIVLVAASLLWMHGSWRAALGFGLSLLLIDGMGLWQPMIETLILTIFSGFVASIIAVLLALTAASIPFIFAGLRIASYGLAVLPVILYLLPVLLLIGIGPVAVVLGSGIIAAILATGKMAAEIRAIPASLLHTGRSFGFRNWQVTLTITLPCIMPIVMITIHRLLLLSLSLVTLSALIGAGGLGEVLLMNYQRFRLDLAIEAGLALAIIAFLLDYSARSAPHHRGGKSRIRHDDSSSYFPRG